MLRKFAYLAVAVLIALLVVGCGGGATEPPAPTDTPEIINPPVIKEDVPTSTPRPTPTPEPAEPEATEEAVIEEFTVNGVTMPFGRNEVIINDQVDFSIFDSFNPFIPNGEHYQNGVGQYAREYLWVTNYATGEIIPWLGESWEYNDDYTQLTLYLRKGVNWNDGEPFTAKDVVFTLGLAMDPAYDDLSGVPHTDATFWTDVTAADDYTVVINMTEPRPRQHLIFWCRIVGGQMIVPEHIWANVEDIHTYKNNPPVWTGPYELMAVYPENKVFVWERNEDYWGKAIGNFPAAKYAIYRTGPGADQQLAEVKDNNMDIFGLGYDIWSQNKADIPQINQVIYVDPCPRAAWFNTTVATLDEPEERRAMSMLMNREKWGANIWTPPSKPAQGLWADYRNLDKFINEDAKETWGTLKYDPDAALALLESIGYTKDGNVLLDPNGEQAKIAVTTPVGVGGNEYLMGQDFTEELKAFGYDATFEYVSTFWDTVDTGEHEIGFWWFCGATVDPTELYNKYTCDKVAPVGTVNTNENEGRYCNEEYQATLDALNAIDPDDPAAMDLYMKMFDLWMQDPPGVPLIETYYSVSYNTTYWDGMLSNENLYTVPFNWWGQIEQVYFNTTPSGK